MCDLTHARTGGVRFTETRRSDVSIPTLRLPGKIMDYVQEDVDSMRKEMKTWSKESKEHGVALADEQGYAVV